MPSVSPTLLNDTLQLVQLARRAVDVRPRGDVPEPDTLAEHLDLAVDPDGEPAQPRLRGLVQGWRPHRLRLRDPRVLGLPPADRRHAPQLRPARPRGPRSLERLDQDRLIGGDSLQKAGLVFPCCQCAGECKPGRQIATVRDVLLPQFPRSVQIASPSARKVNRSRGMFRVTRP